ncbi:hypothetical protein ACOMHN_028897 [Nucella lapillus]
MTMAIHPNALLLSAVTLACTLTASVTAMPQTTGNPVAVRQAAKQLVQDIHTVVAAAKNGQYLNALYQDILDLQFKATELVETLPGEVSECETNLVIKMAAAGTGSHEVLTVMLAQDPMAVLNGRLALTLAFLEHVAGQLEDELILSTIDVGPHASAIAFGANTTASIIESADKAIKAVASGQLSNNNNSNNKDLHNRVRRQSVNLGSGWSMGLGGVKWQSQSGMTTFAVKPTFSSGVLATLTIRF